MANPPRATDAALWQMREDGFSYRDIADYYGLSIDSVRGRVSRYKRTISAQTGRDVNARIWREVNEWIDDDGLLENAVDDPVKWKKEHIFINRLPPSGIKFKYTSRGFGRLESVLKKGIGNGIEYYSYIWYSGGSWYYGIEDPSEI